MLGLAPKLPTLSIVSAPVMLINLKSKIIVSEAKKHKAGISANLGSRWPTESK